MTSVCFTNDGHCILLSTLENSVMLLDKDSGEMLAEYTGHRNKEFKCDSCLSAKDTHVISGSEDGKIYLWDLVTAKPVQTLDHGLGQCTITSLSHHPKDACLVSAAQNRLFIWRSEETSAWKKVSRNMIVFSEFFSAIFIPNQRQREFGAQSHCSRNCLLWGTGKRWMPLLRSIGWLLALMCVVGLDNRKCEWRIPHQRCSPHWGRETSSMVSAIMLSNPSPRRNPPTVIDPEVASTSKLL